MLTKKELDFLNDKYSFTISGNDVVVECNNLKRRILHSANESFSLNTQIRRITITKETISLWKNIFKDQYSLLDVQNAMNSLLVTYQPTSVENIQQVLKNESVEIKKEKERIVHYEKN